MPKIFMFVGVFTTGLGIEQNRKKKQKSYLLVVELLTVNCKIVIVSFMHAGTQQKTDRHLRMVDEKGVACRVVTKAR